MHPSRRVFLAGLGGLALLGCGRSPRVVLYCAQDREFALDVLERFREQTGVQVVPKFDTEKNKSVGPLRRARGREEPAALRRVLEQRDRLDHPPPGPGPAPAAREPVGPRLPRRGPRPGDHTWHAFAARARVLIVNTDRVKEPPSSLLDLTDPRWRGEVVMARPQFGTTATQVACLFDVLGKTKAEAYLER